MTGSRRRREWSGGGIPTPVGLSERGLNADINMTPMIDVMMALLIIMMVITPVLSHFAARPPQAVNVVPEAEADAITLGIDNQGSFYVGDIPISSDNLAGYLSALYSRRPGDHLIYLRADQSVGYDRVLTAIAAARQAGVRRIGAIAEPLEGQAPTAAAAGDAP